VLNSSKAISIYADPKKAVMVKGDLVDYLGRSNTSCDKFIFVDSGWFRQLEQMPEKEVSQWINGPGSFVTGLSAFLFRTKSTWNFRALTDCVVYSINYDDYMMLNQFVEKWSDFEKVFISKCVIYMEGRIS
jgi:CRP/FNR family transcriptional regulator, anaerobic regulatory protein